MADKRPRVLAVEVDTCDQRTAAMEQATTYVETAAESLDTLTATALAACKRRARTYFTNDREVCNRCDSFYCLFFFFVGRGFADSCWITQPNCQVVMRERSWQNPMQVCACLNVCNFCLFLLSRFFFCVVRRLRHFIALVVIDICVVAMI